MDLANLLHGAPKPYSETYRKRQAPPSPPVEEPKCSLPSISTLLEGADAQHSAKRQRLSPVSQRYDTVRLPPTPPLRPGSGSGHAHSPSELSSKPVAEHHHQHPHRSSISSTGSTAAIPHVAGPYASPAPSVSSYTSPVDAPQPQQPMYYARPPSTTTFQPATPVPAPPMAQPQAQQPQQPQQQAQPAPAAAAAAAAAQSPSLITPVTPAWQHHHYFPPSTTTAYQQTHERYICRTCHKAFSRPSSLRIHSHSHTGEKPFRCTHAGCGKAFSVRSNMKRHERGCHSGRPAPAAPVALVS